MAEEKLRDAWSGIRGGGRVRAKRQVILAEGFDREDGENHTIGVINVEHESGDHSENEPLGERARGARLAPIPEEKSHDESGMRMGPRGIEIHVDG